MHSSSLGLVALVLTAATSSPTRADIFHLTYTGNNGISGVGTLNAVANTDGTFTALSGFLSVTASPWSPPFGGSGSGGAASGGGPGAPFTNVSGSGAAISSLSTLAWTLLLQPDGSTLSLGLPLDSLTSDNRLRPMLDPVLTTHGLLFSDGTRSLGLWGIGPDNRSMCELTDASHFQHSQGQVTLTPTPGSLALLGLGGLVARPRRR